MVETPPGEGRLPPPRNTVTSILSRHLLQGYEAGLEAGQRAKGVAREQRSACGARRLLEPVS